MIINKAMKKVSGYIEYSFEPKRDPFGNNGYSEDDLDSMYESDTFNSIIELQEKMLPDVLNTIKEEYNAEKVWISNITFRGKSEDGETSSDIYLDERGCGGYVSTIVRNEDIDNRAVNNLRHIKNIVDNTLEHYPIKFSTE